MIKKLVYIGLFSCYCAVSLQAVVAVGDTPDSAITFQFSIGSAIYDSVNEKLWTLSGQDTSSLDQEIQKYGISFTPFIPVDASLNLPLISSPFLTTKAVITTVDADILTVPAVAVDNPLLGQAYGSVTFLGTHLAITNALTPQFVYYIQSVAFNDGSSGLASAEGTSIINQLDLGDDVQVKLLAGTGSLALFIANATGTFGTATSYLSYAIAETVKIVVDGKNTECTSLIKKFDQLIDRSTQVLTAGGPDLSTIGASVTMYPSPISLQTYVGLDVVADTEVDARGAGLFCATVTTAEPYTLTLSSVIPDDVVVQGLNTPVSVTRNNRVLVSNITTTVTSTGLSYLITSRYDGSGQQSIYAMPMVTMPSANPDNGKIAKFDSITQTFKIEGIGYRVQGFDTVIDDADEIDVAGDAVVIARIQVGAGPVPLSSGNFIEQLVAQGDAVYITIQRPFGLGSTPGMFKSQALFDEQGRIMSWSPWQRVAGTNEQMLFSMKNHKTGATMYVSGNDSNTIQQTTWNKTSLTTLMSAVNDAMPFGRGGVQGLVPVSNQTSGLADYSLVVATGNNAVVIAQTGSLDGDGNLVMDSPQEITSMNSSWGLDIGSVVTATFAHDQDENNWFFMGGDSGLSVLSDDTTGITFESTLPSLASLSLEGMSCKTLGSFKFVKKIVNDGSFLYVLTLDGVYRISLVANKFTLENPSSLDAVSVVKASDLNVFASCLDMLVDNGLIILGTTAGLYSINVAGGLPAVPVSIEIPGGLSAISRITTISSSANNDQTFYTSSNLYVLSVNYSLQQARLNRFTISDGVITPIQDQLLQDQNGPLLIFDYMSNNIFIDGSLGFATSYRIGDLLPTIKYMQYSLQAGRSSSQTLIKNNSKNLSIAAVLSSLGLTSVGRDFASGELMLAADFGLLTDS